MVELNLTLAITALIPVSCTDNVITKENTKFAGAKIRNLFCFPFLFCLLVFIPHLLIKPNKNTRKHFFFPPQPSDAVSPSTDDDVYSHSFYNQQLNLFGLRSSYTESGDFRQVTEVKQRCNYPVFK